MAIPQIGRCPVWSFKPSVSFGAEGRLAAGLYGVRIPKELGDSGVPAPTFVSPTTMVSMLRTQGGSQGSGLGIVHGLTTADFTVRFPDPARQWKQVRPGSGPPFWQFQGGDVSLDVVISVYVLEGDRPRPNDPVSSRIFAIIFEHELLHVLDDVDIVSRWMPPRASQDEKVKKYLTNAEPVDDSMYRFWFQGAGLGNWLRDGLWAPERNARRDVRDSRTQYGILRRQVEDLRIQATNQPSP
jgi:hypothetical protein